MVGQIVWYNVGKGYGFIACGPKQYFFSVKYFAPGFQPVQGRQVEFDIAPGLPGKPPMATNVHYADGNLIDQKFAGIASLAGSGDQGGAR